MPKVGDHVMGMRAGAAGAIAIVGDGLAVLFRAAGALVPRRLLRLAEKIEGRRNMRAGHFAAVAFLMAFVLYGLIAGGHMRRMAETALIGIGLSVGQIEITGHAETPELAILEKLELDSRRSLLTYDVAAARKRLTTLPWVADAGVRKVYPDRLQVTVTERVPYALWQRNNKIAVIDHTGTTITAYDDQRFSVLPLVVGRLANERAETFLPQLAAHPALAERIRASVYVAGRRWNLLFESGITVKLPEANVGEALEQLAVLDAVDGILSRDVTVVDLRLADRITVRLPDDTAETRKAPTAAELQNLRKAGTPGTGART